MVSGVGVEEDLGTVVAQGHIHHIFDRTSGTGYTPVLSRRILLF
jgi:hypothetical protein